jgi:hypothetical protein
MAQPVKKKKAIEKIKKKPVPPVSVSDTPDSRSIQKNVGKDAGELARAVVLQQCAKAGLTVPKVLSGIVTGMTAKEQRVKYSEVDRTFKYSKKMVSWATRQKAYDQAIAILGIKAPEKNDVNLKTNIPTMIVLDFNSDTPNDKGKE